MFQCYTSHSWEKCFKISPEGHRSQVTTAVPPFTRRRAQVETASHIISMSVLFRKQLKQQCCWHDDSTSGFFLRFGEEITSAVAVVQVFISETFFLKEELIKPCRDKYFVLWNIGLQGLHCCCWGTGHYSEREIRKGKKGLVALMGLLQPKERWAGPERWSKDRQRWGRWALLMQTSTSLSKTVKCECKMQFDHFPILVQIILQIKRQHRTCLPTVRLHAAWVTCCLSVKSVSQVHCSASGLLSKNKRFGML